MQLHPEFIKRMEEELGDQAPAFLSSYEEKSRTGLRMSARKGYAPGFDRVPWCPQGYYVPDGLRMGKAPLHAVGAYYLQEPSAMAPAEALGVLPGMRVLDLCAAPGGKATQLADHLQGQGLLVANEIHPARARILLENVERMGVPDAVVLNESPDRIARHFGAWFDAVLVDAPCSGEGMFRRDPDAIAQWTPDSPRQCHERQLEILESAAQCLRGGGAMVYSTCTFNHIENERTIEVFLSRHPEFRLDTALNLPGIPCREGMAHLYPHQLSGEGHFLARLLKTDGDSRELPPFRAQKPDPRWTKFAAESLPDAAYPGFYAQGEWLCALPDGMPDVTGLRVLRAGVQLGRLASGRLEPAHALALSVDPQRAALRFAVTEEEALRYLHGDTLSGQGAGWGLVAYKDRALGWGKCSGGQIKNHYPKGLRWKS